MDETKIIEILTAMESLGFASSIVGVLRAFSKGIITRPEYDVIQEWMYARGVPRNWYRTLVWSVPQ